MIIIYTILQVHCSNKIIAQTKKALELSGANVNFLCTASWKEAQNCILKYPIHFMIVNLEYEYENAMKILQDTPRKCRYNPIILLAKDKQQAIDASFLLYSCECVPLACTCEDFLNLKNFLQYHFHLYQSLKLTRNNSICVNKSSIVKNICPDKILFIEATKHKCIIHTEEASITITQPLYKIKQDPAFEHLTQCHRSFLVNTKYIDKIDKSSCPWTVYFTNCTQKALISRAYQKLICDSLSLVIKQ